MYVSLSPLCPPLRPSFFMPLPNRPNTSLAASYHNMRQYFLDRWSSISLTLWSRSMNRSRYNLRRSLQAETATASFFLPGRSLRTPPRQTLWYYCLNPIKSYRLPSPNLSLTDAVNDMRRSTNCEGLGWNWRHLMIPIALVITIPKASILERLSIEADFIRPL